MFDSSNRLSGIALSLTVLLFSGVEAQAMMLTGGIEQSAFFYHNTSSANPIQAAPKVSQPAPKASPAAVHPTSSLPSKKPIVDLNSQVPVSGCMTSPSFNRAPQAAPAALPASALQSSTTPSSVQGVWACTTQVVESSAPTVQTGTIVECQIKFQALDANRVVAQWAQKGWAPAAAAVGKCVGNVLRIVHESTNSGSSAARSDDYVQVVNPHVMRSISIVNQFENGAYVGSYKTQSILKRI